MKLDLGSFDYVFLHYDAENVDGRMSGLMAYQFFKALKKEVDLIGVRRGAYNYGLTTAVSTDVRALYFFTDLGLSMEHISPYFELGQVVVIDHHCGPDGKNKTLDGFEGLVCSPTECSATLMQEWIKQQMPFDALCHLGYPLGGRFFDRVLGYVKDRDLWVHEYEETNGFDAYLRVTLDGSLADVDPGLVAPQDTSGWTMMRCNADLCARLQESEVDYAYRGGPIGEFKIDGLKGFLYLGRLHVSDVCDRSIEQWAGLGIPVAACVYSNNGFWRVSVRSEGSVDVGAWCARHGGGGHTTAAGCQFNTYEEMKEALQLELNHE